ncbi:site-specific integrase [Leisingera caerulea]|uniref:Integrase arm-type DNA-binding domain-containing protein n=1 Tax=Leisingera caerulea TaxID=506591 RepID=A0A9Q9HG96_LEICA|nr:site-specific integrase [Leisingera caerulea]UWQ53237.1 integrase arm-type DNA-binding domain-containing protein [Leisingera caerulea]
MKLTKRSVDAMETLDKDYLVWDADVTGFGVRVYPSGKKTYLIQYRAGRRTRRLTIGQHGVLTADQARREAKRLIGDVARGADPSGEKQKRLQAPTIAALCDRFLTEYADQHCKPSTARTYRTIVRNHIRPKLGAMAITEVMRTDIVNLHYSMRETPYQANRTLSVLSKMFNVAEDWDLRPEGSNPTRRVKKNREEEKKRYLTDQEQFRLGQVLSEVAVEGSETIHVVSAIMLLLLTGCRLGEIVTLKWEYVHSHHLDLPDSKTGRRRIPLPREAYDILMTLPRREGNPYVILGKTDDGYLTDLERPWRRIRSRAGLDDVRIHDLRHTYASVAMKDGIDPFTLKEILGHRNLQTTLRYAHLADDAVQRAAGSVASRVAASLRPGAPSHPQLRVVR